MLDIIRLIKRYGVKVFFRKSWKVRLKYISSNISIKTRLDYDFIMIDIDSPANYRNYKISNNDEHYFVTGFDIYSLRRGVNVFKALINNTKIKKVYFSQHMTKAEDEYLNFLSTNEFIKWQDEIIYFPVDLQDMEIINQNEKNFEMRNIDMNYNLFIGYIKAFFEFIIKPP